MVKKDPNRRRIWTWTLADGVKVKAPHPMTKSDFKKWKTSPKGRGERKRLEEAKELRGTPTWSTMRGIWPTASKRIIDSKTKQNLKKKGKKPTVDECQTPSQKAQMGKDHEGFTRIAEYSDSPAGKRAAERFADKVRDFEGEDTDDNARQGEEGDRQVRVLRSYCKDVPDAGWYWTVWINERSAGKFIDTGLAKKGKKDRQEYAYRSGLRKGKKRYHTGVSQKIYDNAACPTCEAEKGQRCVTPAGKGTNPHQARIKLYEGDK